MGFFRDFKEDLSQAVSDVTIDEKELQDSVSDTQPDRLNEAEAALVEDKLDKELTSIKENAVITKSMVVDGDINTSGSIEIAGTVNGDIMCEGKVVITGEVTGNIRGASVVINSANVEGDVVCDGELRIGEGSVVIGNVTAKNARFSGALKGNIDVDGSVNVESTAVIAGDIKCKTIQIDAGSVVEGHCSLCYAKVTTSEFFQK